MKTQSVRASVRLTQPLHFTETHSATSLHFTHRAQSTGYLKQVPYVLRTAK